MPKSFWAKLTAVAFGCLVIARLAVLAVHVFSGGPSHQDQVGDVGWTTRQHVDKLTGDTSTYADETVKAEIGGHFEVKAECSAAALTFTFDYFASERDDDPASHLAQDTDSNGEAVPLRLRIDDNDVKLLRSTSNFANEASIFFYDDRGLRYALSRGMTGAFASGAQAGGMGKRVQSDAKALGALGDLTAMFGMVAVRERAAGTSDDFIGAKIIKVEVPLADGRKEVVPISTQDVSFQSFLAACAGEGSIAFSPHKPICPAGREMTTLADNKVFSPDDLSKPLELNSEGGDVIIQPSPETLPPGLCLVRLKGRAEDDPGALSVIANSGLEPSDEYHAIDRDRTWIGTEAGFMPALQERASKYAATLKMDPAQFSDEFAAVDKLVHRCAEVSKSDFDHGLAKLGPAYSQCDTYIVNISTELHKQTGGRDIIVFPSLRNLHGEKGGFSIEVDATPGPGSKQITLSTLFHHYGIIHADFPTP